METKHWNAGDAVCGALVVGLKRQIEALDAGEMLRVTAASSGAPVDLPAWCRVTGHTLIEADHPVYVLRKNND